MSDVRANNGVPVLAQFGGVQTPSACAPLVVDSATGYIYSWKTGDVIVAAGMGGTVTSVAETFTGGLISVGGSPITGSGTLALTVAGTSGGIPYFSGATSWASTALLAANQIVLGGGAGTAPATLGSLGTTTTVLHGNAAGAPTFGAVVNADLANSSVTYNGKTVALGASATLGLASSDFANQGTTTTVLHGNAAGNPSFAAVSMTADVTGTLPVGNGGTGNTTGTATTNANLTGPITSVGNATSIASQTGTGTKFVVDTSPTLVTPLLGTPTSGNLANCTGYPGTTALVTAGTITTGTWNAGAVTSSGLITGNLGISVGGGNTSLNGTITITNSSGVVNWVNLPAFAAGDKYLIISAAGNVHVSGLGPAS